MRLGPYTLDQEFGRGASGVVFRGRSPEGKPVAIKLLSKQSPEVLERFQREARLHEQLGAEAGFVPFLDMGLAEGRPYLVMPLLQGGTLRDRLQRGPLSVRGALELGQRLATALGRAHALGIVHRDLKPENVLFDDQGHAFLADLGMAKHFRHDLTGASQSVVLSLAGEVRGTVSYMPPEQLTDASSAGPPADVFSLGAVLYECLSGEPPFNADTYVALLVQIAGAIHVPLRKRCECPPWFDALIEACLAEDPAKRPPEGLALAALIAKGPARSAPGGGRSRRAAATILGLSLVASALAGAVLLGNPPEGEPSASPTSSALTATSPSPEDTRPPGHERFPAAWADLLRSEHLTLTAAWQPAGVSHAGQVTITKDGVVVTGEESVFALGEGPPLALISALPGLRRWTGYAEHDTLFALREEGRLRLINLANGSLRSEVAIRPEGRLAAVAFGGVSAVVAHGKQLATYGILPGGKGKSNPNFATLPGIPYSLAASRIDVVAGHGSSATFLNSLGKVTRLRDYGSPVAQLAYPPPNESPLALVATRDGRLHVHDAQRDLLGVVETGLEPVQGLCAGRRFAALVGEQGLVVVDLETRQVVDRLDLSGLGIELAGVGINPEEDALAIGTEDGQVLRYRLSAPGEPPPKVIPPSATWGDRGGRHAKAVTQTAANERYLLSSDRTGAIHVWDPASGQATRTIKSSQRDPVFALGPSGKLWAADLGRVRQWDVATGHELRRLPFKQSVVDLTLREDEAQLAILGLGGVLEVWDLKSQTRRLNQRFDLQGKSAQRVALLPDGSLALGYSDGNVVLRDPSGAEVWTRQVGLSDVQFLQPLPEGQLLAACLKGEITTWNVHDGRRLLAFLVQPIHSLSIHGRRLLLGISNGRIEVRDLASGEALWDRASEVGIQPRVSLRAEDEALVGGADRVVRLLRFEGPGRLQDLWPQPAPLEPLLAFGFEAGLRVTTVDRRRATTRDLRTGDEVSVRELGFTTRARWGGAHFLTTGSTTRASRRGILGLFAWRAGDQSAPRQVRAAAPDSFALSADGRVAAYPSSRRRGTGVVIVDLETMAQRVLETGTQLGLQLSARGELLIATRGGGIEIWALRGDRRLNPIPSPAGLLSFLPTTPPLLCEAQLYGKVRVLDPLSGRVVSSFTPRARLRPTRITPDPRGDRVAFCFGDGALELWAIPQGRRLARLQLDDPSDAPAALAFSPAGDQLAVMTGRGRLQLFDVPR